MNVRVAVLIVILLAGLLYGVIYQVDVTEMVEFQKWMHVCGSFDVRQEGTVMKTVIKAYFDGALVGTGYKTTDVTNYVRLDKNGIVILGQDQVFIGWCHARKLLQYSE